MGAGRALFNFREVKMAGKKKVTRAAGLTLAIALGSASTMSPVAHAQEGGPSSPATSPSSATGAPSGSASAITSTATVTTTTTAPVVTTDTSTENKPESKPAAGDAAPVLKALAELGDAKNTGGSGTARVEYNNGEWTFTALAKHPDDGFLYAISKDDNGKPAGRLLQINPEDNSVVDRGAIKLAGGNVADIDAASFTGDGTLVLFEEDGDRIFARSLNDVSSLKGTVNFGKPIERTGSDPKKGSPITWVSDPNNDEALLAIARGGNTLYIWTLDPSTGTAESRPAAIEDSLKSDLGKVKAFEYAYGNANGEKVFADAFGRTVTLKGDSITAVAPDTKEGRSIAGVIGGNAGTNIVTGTVKAEPKPPQENQDTQVDPQENNQPATGEWLHEMTITVITADGKYVEGAEFQVVGNDGKSVGSVAEDAYLGEGVYRVQVQLPEAPQQGKILKLEVTDAPVGYETRTASFRPEDTSVTITLPRDPSVSTTNVPNRILAGVKEAQPVVSSALKPIAAIAGLNAATGRNTTTRTTSTNTTSYTATRNTGGMSTGRTTRATSTSVRSNSTSARVVANQTATSAAVYTDSDDDGYLADTGTPMRAVISLGIISLLIGAAYLALGRRREA